MSPLTTAGGQVAVRLLERERRRLGDDAKDPLQERVHDRDAQAHGTRCAPGCRRARPRSAPTRTRSLRGRGGCACSLTMSERRSGIIIRTPSTPPTIASVRIVQYEKYGSPTLWPAPLPRNRKPGRVNTTPAAIDSPAEPMVWTMLFSRIVDDAEPLEHRDRQHRDRDRRRHGQARLQREVDRRGAEDDAEHDAEDDRLDGELREAWSAAGRRARAGRGLAARCPGSRAPLKTGPPSGTG